MQSMAYAISYTLYYIKLIVPNVVMQSVTAQSVVAPLP